MRNRGNIMNALHINKTRPAARTRGPVRGYALRALPWGSRRCSSCIW